MNLTNNAADTVDASLLALRFPRKKNSDGILPDYFIKLWGDLAYFCDHLQTKGRVRHACKYITGFLYDLARCGAPDEQKLAQLTESACVYLRCCKTDSRFSSSFLGTVHLGQSKVDLKLANHVYGICVTLLRQTGLEQEAALLGQALTTAFRQEFPHLLPLYETIVADSVRA